MIPEIIAGVGFLAAVSIAVPYVLGWFGSAVVDRSDIDRLFLTAGSFVRIATGLFYAAAAEAVLHSFEALRAWRVPADPLVSLYPIAEELFRQGRRTAFETLLVYAGAEILVCLLLSRLSLRLTVKGLRREIPFRVRFG